MLPKLSLPYGSIRTSLYRLNDESDQLIFIKSFIKIFHIILKNLQHSKKCRVVSASKPLAARA